jgi:integrase
MRMGQIRLKPVPTLPFEEDEMQRIIEACDRHSARGTYGSQNRDRMRTLTWLMRYSGLRIRDSVTCRRDRLKGNRLFLYQAKTGVPVYCPMPPFLVEALHALPGRHPDYFFWTGSPCCHHRVAHSFAARALLGGEESVLAYWMPFGPCHTSGGASIAASFSMGVRPLS